jgi:hypothetical protein
MPAKRKGGPSCTLCGESRDKAKKPIAGPEFYICDTCVDSLNAKESSGQAKGKDESTPATKAGTKCSFCGKSQDQVKTIIAGPGVHICNECVVLCQEILEAAEVSTSDALSKSVQDFDGTVAAGDVSTFKKGDFVVCRVMEEQVGSYKVMVLTEGPEASLVSPEKLSPGNMVIALYVRSEEDKIVLVGHQPS